jgi:short-subunit dehydrogenase
MDANDCASHVTMLNKAEADLNGIDTVLIAHGTLSNQQVCEQEVDLALQEIYTNALSVVALLTHVANRLAVKRAGTIAVISSVAGDRGRESNYVYGSAKAMVTAFTSGLRQRLYKSGVAVVTIKPGYVDTPMTTGCTKGPLWATPASVAASIVKAIDKRRDVVYVPWFWWVVMGVINSLPEKMFKAARF